MKVIKCDVCGKELDRNDVYNTMDFMNYGSNIELCKKCYDVYKGFESSFKIEQHKISEAYNEAIGKLKEEYKKLIDKYAKNN